jgi:hypothetical protein
MNGKRRREFDAATAVILFILFILSLGPEPPRITRINPRRPPIGMRIEAPATGTAPLKSA